MAIAITMAVKEFYLLQLLEATALGKIQELRRRTSSVYATAEVSGQELRQQERYDWWERDFGLYRDQFNAAFSQAIYDYTVLACSGEMRHAMSSCRSVNPYFGHYGKNRGRVFAAACRYTPESLLATAKSVFSCDRWEGSGMGGELWAAIAEAGQMRGEVDPVTWIDHCIDLSHNNAPYFDKADARIFFLESTASFRLFLDIKHKCSPLAVVVAVGKASPGLLELVVRAAQLGLVPSTWATALVKHPMHTLSINALLAYQPITWGEIELPDILVPRVSFSLGSPLPKWVESSPLRELAALNAVNMAGRVPIVRTVQALNELRAKEFRPYSACPIYCNKPGECGTCSIYSMPHMPQKPWTEGTFDMDEAEAEQLAGNGNDEDEDCDQDAQEDDNSDGDDEIEVEEDTDEQEEEEETGVALSTITSSGIVEWATVAAANTSATHYPSLGIITYDEAAGSDLLFIRTVSQGDGDTTGSVVG